jgi:copper chaperone CopZ
MKKILLALIPVALTLALLLAGPALSLEYQWKFFLPTMTDPGKGVQVFELLHSIPGVYDVDINVERRHVMFFFNDEKTDESSIKKQLQAAGFQVNRMMLLEEPREGVMN